MEFEDPEENKREGLTCEICLDIFVNQETLQEHYKCHKQVPLFEAEELPKDDEHANRVKSIQRKIYYCHHHDMCTKLFTQKELLQHCSLHDIEIDNPTVYFKKALRKKVKTTEESCEICFELFPTKQALDLHYENHKNVHQCTDCNAGFKRIMEYVAHTKNHRVDNMYQCPSCEVQSEDRRKILSHLQLHECYKRYKCKICEKRFPTYQPYNEHVKIDHMGEPPPSCEICGEKFKTSHNLLTHKIKRHSVCRLCDKKFPSYELMQKHKLTHNPYVCDICGEVYTSKGSFGMHIKTHKDEKLFKCSFCSKKFISNNCRKDHELTHIKIEDPTEYSMETDSQKVNTSIIEESCEICFELFPTEQALDLHYENHRNIYQCTDCNAGFKKIMDYVAHTKSHRVDNMYQCPLCNVQSDDERRILSHLQLHECYKRYKCKICEKRFPTYQPYNEHVKIDHMGELPLSCDICDEKFISSQYLNNHRNKRHSACNLCGKRFPSYELMKRHRMTHDLYKCDICGEECRSKAMLGLHAMKAHKDEKTFKCSFCNKKFISKNCKKEHELTHTEKKDATINFAKTLGRKAKTMTTFEHPCEICFELFASKQELNLHYESHENVYNCDDCNAGFKKIFKYVAHARTHRKDNMYQCPSCDVQSDQRQKMWLHIHAHESYKRYKCKICDKRFRTFQPYDEHVRIYHNGEPPLSCEICGESFKSTQSLANHKIKKHSECRLCGERFSSYELMRAHRLTHKPYVCNICGEVYTNKEPYEVHIKTH